MKKNSYLYVIVLAISFMVLAGAGCKDTQPTDAENPFIGGTLGIVAEFEPMGIIEDSIETVWEGETFPIEVNVKNKGEEDITVGKLWITLKGQDMTLFDFSTSSVTEASVSDPLEGVDEYNALGGEEVILFKSNAKYESVIGASYIADFFADVEYDYTTQIAVPKVCFKADQMKEGVCEVQELKKVYSSGSPLRAISAEEAYAGSDKISLTFEIENAGGGDTKLQADAEYDPIYSEIAFSIDDTALWTCTSGGQSEKARFVDGKATIVCKTSELPEDADYTKQVTLTLTYTYKDVIQKTLKIKQNPED